MFILKEDIVGYSLLFGRIESVFNFQVIQMARVVSFFKSIKFIAIHRLQHWYVPR
jgi:hypothetical protein